MPTIRTTALVNPDRTVTLVLPPDFEPGVHDLVLVSLPHVPVDPAATSGSLLFADWPPNPAVLVDPNNTFRREDLYGDDGR